MEILKRRRQGNLTSDLIHIKCKYVRRIDKAQDRVQCSAFVKAVKNHEIQYHGVSDYLKSYLAPNNDEFDHDIIYSLS
jgi:DNA helicase IV